MYSNISSGPMKIVVTGIFSLCVIFSASAQITYTLCTSGTWTNTGGTARFSNGGACNITPNSITFNDNDVLSIPSSLSLTLAREVVIAADITVDLSGNITFANGKLRLSMNSAINLWTGGTLTCDGTGNCGNNDQISIGIDPDPVIQWKGQDVEDINSGPRPISLTDQGIVTMPVTLKSFDISIVDKNVGLSWTTISEENFDRFVIQRSGNGQDYYDIGERKGQGQNIYELESNYSFEDLTPLIGFNYYRLKAIDIDNSFEYFGPKVARIKADKALTVFPNPGEGNEITYYANFNPDEGDRLVLRNSVGMVLYSDVSPKSLSTIDLSSMKLSAGLYFLEYIGAEHKQVVRVFVK